MRGGRGLRGVAHARHQQRKLGPGSVLCAQDDVFSSVLTSGVGRFNGVLSRPTAAQLRRCVLAQLAHVRAANRWGDERLSPGTHQVRAKGGQPRTRWDLRLPLAPIVRLALNEALFGPRGLGEQFSALAGGDEAELFELAAVVAAPGAAPQLLHCDTAWHEDPCLFTAFIALQDVVRESGPTRFLPTTHDEESHRGFAEDPEAFLAKAGSVIALLKAGDASIYDSRLLHAGMANLSTETRVLLTISFMHVEAQDNVENEDVRSIRPVYKPFRFDICRLRRGI